MFNHRQSKRSLGGRVAVLGVVAIAAAPQTAGADQPDDRWGMFPGERIMIDAPPWDVATGDLNGDGKPDLVVASEYGPRVLLGDGGNRFAPMVLYDTPINATDIELGDLDGDGDLDIVASSRFFRTAVVLLNDGEGNFASQLSYGFIDFTRGLTLGDWDGDGDVDMAVGSFNALVLRLNRGDGTFSGRITIGSTSNPEYLTSGDLDGDGDSDIVGTSITSDHVCVWSNLGIGVFVEQPCISTPLNPNRPSLGDLDGDGDVDLVFVSSRDDSACIMLNDGDGDFGGAVSYPLAGRSQLFSTLADVDSDGDLDIAASVAGNVSVLYNDGDGSFADRARFSVGRDPSGLIAADLDGDGALDLVAATEAGVIDGEFRGAIVALRNTGVGSFETGRSLADSGFTMLGHMNGDDHLDIVQVGASPAQRGVHVYLSDGEGSFAEAIVLDTGSTGSFAALGDLDEDGDTDLVKYDEGEATVSAFLNDGIGTLGTPRVSPIDRFELRTLAIGDLDGDGDLDLAISDNFQLDLLLNNGNAQFSLASGLPDSAGTYENHVVDLDGDGDNDIVTADSQNAPPAFGVRLNNGDAGFAPPIRVETDQSVQSLALADLDHDGDQDLAVSRLYLSTLAVEVFRNDGQGVFSSVQTFEGTAGGGRIAFGDLDTDGVLDLVFVNRGNGDVGVRLGVGDGTFGTETRFSTGSSHWNVLIGDLNNDSRPDILTGDSGGARWWFLQNRRAAPVSCSAADLAEPIGLLDLADLTAFVVAFTSGDDDADFDNNGTFDLNDLVAFVEAFVAGCP